MKTTTARQAIQLIAILAVNAALLVGGVWLTGFAWQDLCFLLLPPMVASGGADFALLVLDRMALEPPVPALERKKRNVDRKSPKGDHQGTGQHGRRGGRLCRGSGTGQRRLDLGHHQPQPVRHPQLCLP